MKNLKNTIAAATLLAVLTFGSTFAHAGIIVAGRDGGFAETTKGQACGESFDTTGKVNWGIIVAGLTGIIVAGLTGSVDGDRSGIIVAGLTESDKGDRGGIIVAGVQKCGIIVAG